eukprot:1451952-Amphidinium_carterae.3
MTRLAPRKNSVVSEACDLESHGVESKSSGNPLIRFKNQDCSNVVIQVNPALAISPAWSSWRSVAPNRDLDARLLAKAACH